MSFSAVIMYLPRGIQIFWQAMVMKFGAGRNKPHVRTQLDAALNFYHADGGGRDLFITMAQAGKTTEQVWSRFQAVSSKR